MPQYCYPFMISVFCALEVFFSYNDAYKHPQFKTFACENFLNNNHYKQSEETSKIQHNSRDFKPWQASINWPKLTLSRLDPEICFSIQAQPLLRLRAGPTCYNVWLQSINGYPCNHNQVSTFDRKGYKIWLNKGDNGHVQVLAWLITDTDACERVWESSMLLIIIIKKRSKKSIWVGCSTRTRLEPTLAESRF